jgi:hypothetical protein
MVSYIFRYIYSVFGVAFKYCAAHCISCFDATRSITRQPAALYKYVFNYWLVTALLYSRVGSCNNDVKCNYCLISYKRKLKVYILLQSGKVHNSALQHFKKVTVQF